MTGAIRADPVLATSLVVSPHATLFFRTTQPGLRHAEIYECLQVETPGLGGGQCSTHRRVLRHPAHLQQDTVSTPPASFPVTGSRLRHKRRRQSGQQNQRKHSKAS